MRSLPAQNVPATGPRRSRRGPLAAGLLALVAAGAVAGGALLARAGGAQPPVRATFTAVDDGFVTARQPGRGFAVGPRLLAARSPLARVYLRFRVRGVSGTVT
ncbi:MAG: hypothetical protein QOK40_3729, partial [Miltoncostaeaceae bacterium]|nr:hypothetical protein [Miltoncostaeaceae bacterium]